ncbi:MAG: CoA transferase [Dehalococcoidia bacterium]|nr:CoA transferase [Dehalococcoidia bacterium]
MPQATRALEGVRVIDLTRTTAGLYGVTILADMGADVIKVEPREITPRTLGRFIVTGRNKDGVDMRVIQTYRNRKSLTLEVKNPVGREVFYDLVRQSDVVWDNYRPGVMEGLGIDYNTLSQINPRIICCSITGFGSSGQDARRPGYDPILESLTGLISLTGEAEQAPVYPGTPIADMGTGMYGAHGVLAALYQRQHTGRGQKVEACLMDTCLSFLYLDATHYLNSGTLPQPTGSKGRVAPLVGMFQTQDGYVVSCVQSPEQVLNLCRALGHEEWLEDPRFDTSVSRAQNREALNSLAEEVFRTRSTGHWEEALIQADVPVGRVNTLDQAFADPHIQSRGMVVNTSYNGQDYKAMGCPVRLSDSPPQYGVAPTWGEHTQEVLCDVLGYSPERVEGLRQEKVV